MRNNSIISAFWDNEFGGIFEYDKDLDGVPRFEFNGEALDIVAAKNIDFAKNSCYFIDGQEVCFFLKDGLVEKDYFVCGVFNNWEKADAFRMRYDVADKAFKLNIKSDIIFCNNRAVVPFKFVSSCNKWIGPNNFAKNVEFCKNGVINFLAIKNRTGKNLLRFISKKGAFGLFDTKIKFFAKNGDSGEFVAKTLNLALQYKSDKRLGAFIEKNSTIFRVFAPRAKNVFVAFSKSFDLENCRKRRLYRDENGVWSVNFLEDLSNYFYGYVIDGKLIADPYAMALVGPDGAGIILNDDFLKKEFKSFNTPKWSDLVIVEAHVRDLIKNCDIDNEEKLGFKGLINVLDESFYLKNLGVNAIELQPITEYDSACKDEYHWGYMPANYFAPSSNYASSPHNASQVKEFQELVDKLHSSGIAVILDVVYNHTGVQNALAKIDREYYQNTIGDNFTNYSGCGNDLRVDAPMAEKLIIDSLISFIRHYNVDGFRFDLAELLGKPLLQKIEVALKKEKPDVILIAEPWSFKGHIAYDLKDTGWACWNDDYRNFIANYVNCKGNCDGIKYFLSGSLDHLSRFPAQSVNYTESHDDFCWIDKISPNNNGKLFTFEEERKTRIMFVILMMSIGIPMISAGQDFLRSKNGIHNTYNNGNVNALDYQQLESMSGLHEYVNTLIKFRMSNVGKLLRLQQRPSKTFMQFSFAENKSAVLALYNADNSLGDNQILLAVNPHHDATKLPAHFVNKNNFTQILDTQRINLNGLNPPLSTWQNNSITLPKLSCSIWQKI